MTSHRYTFFHHHRQEERPDEHESQQLQPQPQPQLQSQLQLHKRLRLRRTTLTMSNSSLLTVMLVQLMLIIMALSSATTTVTATGAAVVSPAEKTATDATSTMTTTATKTTTTTTTITPPIVLIPTVTTSSSLSSSTAAATTNSHQHQHQHQQHAFQNIFPSGQIPEMAHCNVEDLETANDSQLYTILQELKETDFFRNFVVDLEQPCPLSNNGKGGGGGGGGSKEKLKEKPLTMPTKESTMHTQGGTTSTTSSSSSSSSDTTATATTSTTSSDDNNNQEEEEDHGSCASEGLPDLDPDAEPACHVQMDDPFASTFGSSSTSSSSSSSMTSSIPPPQPHKTLTVTPSTPKEEPKKKTTVQTITTDTSTTAAPTTEEEYACDGGAVADDLDEEDEPLCALKSEDYTKPIRSLIAMALESIRYFGWESESQRKTYQWSQETNPVVTSEQDWTCDENGQLPDAFWQDMCSSITNTDASSKVINLVLNPERNTGYNGTHIWNAIYQENCLANEEILCYEERVLYRLLSGLHTSTTLSIAKHYYPPSKRKNRTHWEPNPTYFMQKFQNHPEHLRNLHFSYVVLLRALSKASTFLQSYDIGTGNLVDDVRSTKLLHRLLDSAILKSCESVFSAFDERLMFANGGEDSLLLSQNFKGVFHNISSILDCVQCSQCKLHGKMAMLGYGTALKILFMKQEESLALHVNRNEIVAFINTIAKFSESIKEARELTLMYWQQEQLTTSTTSTATSVIGLGGTTTTTAAGTTVVTSEMDLVDAAIGFIASLGRQGKYTNAPHVEDALVELALRRDANLLLLFKHYGTSTSADKFLTLAQNLLLNNTAANGVGGTDQTALSTATTTSYQPDAIIVGSGLAGLSAALHMLDRGGTVTIVEKEHLLGGNSNKASSGINACCPTNDNDYGDVLESFRNDTIKSAGAGAQPELIAVLVSQSAQAVSFLRDRVGVDLSLLAQLGGHSHKRTHRPSNGMAGAEIIYGIQKAIKAYKKTGRVKILVDTKVTSLITDETTGRVLGVEVMTKNDGDGNNSGQKLYAPNVVLATGGFAADRSPGSYLERYRPEFLNMPATAGAFSTGDGVSLATALGAGTIDMDKVQIHPTGWVDPKDPNNTSKILAAELMRGVGGILINDEGKRFCNELGTRAYVTNQMLSQKNPSFQETQVWDKNSPIPTFSLVLSSSAAEDGKKHVDLYSHKGLLTRLEGLQALADWMKMDINVLRTTFMEYIDSAAQGKDEFGKTSFRGLPNGDNLEEETFYAGTITPVLHYCMGGITIDTEGNVINEQGDIIPGLHAAGEVTGGVHGHNRLGGNSLLECTVFGSIVGKKLPIQQQQRLPRMEQESPVAGQEQLQSIKDRPITMAEVEQHNNDGDCWVVIHGVVYDLTEFADEHPAGAESIHILAGKDGSDAFAAVHNMEILKDFDEEERVGVLVKTNS